MNMRKLKVVGNRFGHVTYVKKIGFHPDRLDLYFGYCDCGQEVKRYRRRIYKNMARNGGIQYCGNKCPIWRKKHKKYQENNVKHGFAMNRKDFPLYSVWASIKSRCHNPSTPGYEHYGGRGIFFYNEWREDFVKFNNYCLENGWKKGLSIDRIDNERGYELGNIQFITVAENSRKQMKDRDKKFFLLGMNYGVALARATAAPKR